VPSGSVISEFVDGRAPFQTELGSVGIEGRVIKIRIVTDEWLPSPHRCYRYKYEVTDTESPYFQRVDQIHSEVMLSAGHVYVVRSTRTLGTPVSRT
jgi:hypothetical protein